MLSSIVCLVLCSALEHLSIFGEGAQVQLALPDLATVLDTAVIEHQRLQLEASLEPLSSVVLVVNHDNGAETEVTTLKGIIGPRGNDILVMTEEGDPLSLKVWLRAERGIEFVLEVEPP